MLERVALLRRERPPSEKLVGLLVGVHVADARAAFDRHVADRHPLVDRHRLEGWSAVFVGEPDAALDAEAADDREDQILRKDAAGQRPVDLDATYFQRIEGQALRREHVAHLRRADAEGNRAEGAVGRGVAVAARDRHPRLRQSQLGSDHVDDALIVVAGRPEMDAGVAAVALQRSHHFLGHDVEERTLLRAGRHDVIGGGERAIGKRHLPAVLSQHVERLRRRHLMDEVEPDEQLRLPARQHADRVCVPDLLKECGSHVTGLSRRFPRRSADRIHGWVDFALGPCAPPSRSPAGSR